MFLGDEALSEMIQITADLIESEPTMVTLKKDGFVRTPSGGQRPGVPITKTPRKRFFSGIVPDAAYITRDEGEIVKADHVLIGMPDDDMEQKDYFTVDGRHFEIVEIHPARQFQIKGWIVERK